MYSCSTPWFLKLAYKSCFVVLGSASCPAEVCMTSSVSCTCFHISLCAFTSLYTPKFKICLQAIKTSIKAAYFPTVCIVQLLFFFVSVDIFLFILSPVMFVWPFKVPLFFSWLLFLSITTLGTATALAQHQVEFIQQIRRHNALPAQDGPPAEGLAAALGGER